VWSTTVYKVPGENINVEKRETNRTDIALIENKRMSAEES